MNSEGGRESEEFCGVKAREGAEVRETAAVESFKDGRIGVLRRAENKPIREAESEGGGGGGRRRWEGRARKEVMVVMRREAGGSAVGWSERRAGVEREAWPKR